MNLRFEFFLRWHEQASQICVIYMDFEEVIIVKKRLALALSGGSVRAAAHVGVLKALEEYALEPDVVVGTSGGAIVARFMPLGLQPQSCRNSFGSTAERKGKSLI